jgi:hypothetical protein
MTETESAAGDAQLASEMQTLGALLGDTRMRFHKRQTPFASSERLIALDREIRAALASAPSPALKAEVRRLSGQLRELDPH